jgi:hypothetical protein
MAGQKHRPRRMDEKSRTWNIVFPVRLIEEIKDRAFERNMTAASLVREILETPGEVEDNNDNDLREKIFSIVRKEFTHPKYANGKTLGDIIVDRVERSL